MHPKVLASRKAMFCCKEEGRGSAAKEKEIGNQNTPTNGGGQDQITEEGNSWLRRINI